MMFLMVKWI